MKAAVTALGLVALLAGCAAPPPLAPHQARAVALNHEAMQRFEQGDYGRAQQLFEQALQGERALDNDDGIGLNLLNLAQCLQRQGKSQEAGRMLDTLLADPARSFAPAQRAEAALHKALLALQSSQLDDGERWLGVASAACQGQCAAAAKLLNLEARVALERGRDSPALALAAAAVDRSRAQRDWTELANGLRLQATAHLRLRAQAPAAALLQEALALDKQGGQGEKIYQDLLLLGHASQDAGVRRRYWLRARSVAEASGNPGAVQDSTRLLATVPIQGD